MTVRQTSSPGQPKVGYGHPPVETRFRKGQSGNPAGRPKSSRNAPLSPRLKALMREEALRPMSVQLLGKEMTLPVLEAAIRKLAISAAWGRTRELALFLELMNAAEADSEDDEDQHEHAAKDL